MSALLEKSRTWITHSKCLVSGLVLVEQEQVSIRRTQRFFYFWGHGQAELRAQPLIRPTLGTGLNQSDSRIELAHSGSWCKFQQSLQPSLEWVQNIRGISFDGGLFDLMSALFHRLLGFIQSHTQDIGFSESDGNRLPDR